MTYVLILLVLLGSGIARAELPESKVEPCDQIRSQIREHTGIPEKPNTTLLGKIGANSQCRFTSAEAYRAAWGDKPLPPDRTRHNHRNKHERDDD
jgi:hypothetical protein